MAIGQEENKVKRIILLEPVVVGRRHRKRFDVIDVDGVLVTSANATYLIRRNRERPAALDWTNPSRETVERVNALKKKYAAIEKAKAQASEGDDGNEEKE